MADDLKKSSPSEISASADDSRSSVSGSTPVVPRRRGAGFAILLAVIALGVAGWNAWRGYESEQALAALRANDDSSRADQASQVAEQAQRDVASLRTRLADSDRVNKSVRDELLGLEQRSRNVEDAVANLAEQRNSGRDALAVNETEFLLLMAKQKLELFHDPAAALTAYRLADSTLAAAEDPVFLSLRQSIASEAKALENAQHVPVQATIDALERIASGIHAWPAKTTVERADSGTQTRLAGFFGKFIRISRDDGSNGNGAVHTIELARLLAEIDVRTAEAALLARDPAAFRTALERVKNDVTDVVDTDATVIKDAFAEIDKLAATPLAPKLPELGGALSELRNLRASRALTRSPATPDHATTTPPAAPPPPAASTPGVDTQ